MSNSYCIEQIQDEVAAMQRQEASYYSHISSLHSSSSNSNSTIGFSNSATSSFRPFMVQWMWTIHDTFQLCPVVVPTAMYYLDCVSAAANTPLDYQLCGLTALHLAVKVHETRVFQLKQLLEMGNVCFTEEDVIRTERRLLKACQWKLHPPVPEAFLYVLGKIFAHQAPSIPSNALTYLRHAQKWNLPSKPSVLAYASLLAAMEEQSYISMDVKQSLCMKVLQVSGLSASTEGLSHAYTLLLSTLASTATANPTYTSTTTTQVYPKQSSEAHQPLVIQASSFSDDIDLSRLLSPESRDEGEYREVITCSEDSIEVAFCDKAAIDILDAISPRNVEDL